MIRVTLEVSAYGHDYKIEREDPLVPGVYASEQLDRLIREAQASMTAALQTAPVEA